MITKFTHTTLLVRDQDEALAYFTEKFGFEKRVDAPMGPDSRWVTMGIKSQPDMEIILQTPEWGTEDLTVEERAAMVGKMPGLLLATDNCQQTYEDLKAKGVTIVSGPETTPWGTQLIVHDLYGTSHVIVEASSE